jgi:thiol-disulfide isomerase/thioredoxin
VRLSAIAVLLCARLAAAGGVGVGDRLPAFALTDWSGRPLDAAAVAGRPVVVDFWASWCGACKEALPALDDLAGRFADRGVVVLAVNVDRDRGAADRWLAGRLPERRLTLVADPSGTLLARMGAPGMPAVYVVDRTGVVRFAASGYAPDRLPAIERAVETSAQDFVSGRGGAQAR